MLKQIRQLLLKSPRIHVVVTDYKLKQKKKRHHERWAKLIKSSGMIH